MNRGKYMTEIVNQLKKKPMTTTKLIEKIGCEQTPVPDDFLSALSCLTVDGLVVSKLEYASKGYLTWFYVGEG